MMAMPDITELLATIEELREELSRTRVQAEVFRALYTRQAAEIEHLQARLDEVEGAPADHRLRLASLE